MTHPLVVASVDGGEGEAVAGRQKGKNIFLSSREFLRVAIILAFSPAPLYYIISGRLL